MAPTAVPYHRLTRDAIAHRYRYSDYFCRELFTECSTHSNKVINYLGVSRMESRDKKHMTDPKRNEQEQWAGHPNYLGM